MEEIFNNIMEAEFLEETFDKLDSKIIKDYYALFISVMAYYKYINISPEFSAKLYINILNSSFKDIDALLENIFDFFINKSIDDVEKEICDE